MKPPSDAFTQTISDWPEGPFDVIVADPPWAFKNWSSTGDRSVENHYKTQSLDWITQLPVAMSAAKTAHLFMWITGPEFVRGSHLPIMNAWEFEPSSLAFVWLKVNKKALQGRMFASAVAADQFFMGMGHTTRQNVECVVLGRRGKPKRASKSVRQVIVEPRREHSRKPDVFFDLVNEYVGVAMPRRLELFARQPRLGWTVWGDEINRFGALA